MAPGNELLHRPNQVLRIHNQHRRSVVHERAGGDVLDFAELRIERLHHQLAFAKEPVDDQTVCLAGATQDDDRQVVACERRVGGP